MIVAAAGDAPELAADAGAALTVPPGDPAALAAAVRALRDDPALGERLAAAGRQFAAGYRREKLVERLEQLLLEVSAR